MPAYKYLIVGGGMAADAALRGIREIDPLGSIGVIGSEPCNPYNRPPLSKGLWKNSRLESVWRDTERVAGVTIHIQTTVEGIDATQKCVVDDKGASHSYEKLLLATGGAPRRLPFGDDSIIYFRTLADYYELRTLAELGSRFAVIGGGFIGSEIAAALQMNGKRVIMIFPEDGICARIFPADLFGSVATLYRQKGVEVVNGKTLAGLVMERGQLHPGYHSRNPLERASSVYRSDVRALGSAFDRVRIRRHLRIAASSEACQNIARIGRCFARGSCCGTRSAKAM